MAERFFLTRRGDPRRRSLSLLSGPPSSGKTSLLFQFAYNLARDDQVVFICNRRRIETNPPLLSQGVDKDSDVFERIQMRYVDDDEGIKKYFAAFHLHETFPAAVIIDDFGDFFNERSCKERFAGSRGKDMAMVRTLALCHNAIMHANKKSSCELLLSDTHDGDSPRLFLYKRWIPTIFTTKGDGQGSFILRNSNSSGKTAKYSIAFQYLILEGMVCDGEETEDSIV